VWNVFAGVEYTWDPITHLPSTGIWCHGKIVQGITCERSWETDFKSHRQCQSEKTTTDDLVNTPKHTVLSMVGLTSVVWTLGMFQMVTGESCQCIQLTKTDGAVSRWCSTYCLYCGKIRICHPISEHVQSGTLLYQRWTWSQRTRWSIDSNTSIGEGGESGIWRMTKESSPWWWHIQGTEVVYSVRTPEVGRRKVYRDFVVYYESMKRKLI
jgi:hypothetical protein